MHPRQLSISEFSYHLPEHRIATHPLPERDASRLLIYREGQINEDRYRQIAEHLPSDSLLVFNDTRVMEARLLFQKQSGGIIEIFCLEPHEKYGDITRAMMETGEVEWLCLVGGASKWKHGQVLEKRITSVAGDLLLRAHYIEKRLGSFVIRLEWTPLSYSFAEILHLAGAIPLPPYIKREVGPEDVIRYQTIYAKAEGSVAAPTAGLHFTARIFSALEAKGIRQRFVTLHVGAGTFKPVKAERMEDHEMHAEFIDVQRATIQELCDAGARPVIAVGTTSLRTLESLYWIGVQLIDRKLRGEPCTEVPVVTQWEPYDSRQDVLVAASLQAILDWMDERGFTRIITRTQIIIAPGYRFRIVTGLITNFHQPQSTLLLLVAALIGGDWRKMYDHALERGFRFLSYGDGCLLWVR